KFRELTASESESGEPIFAPLTGREMEILDRIARGDSNKEAAVSLSISDQTVKNHMTSILRKLSVNDRTQAVVYAARHGWLKFPDVEAREAKSGHERSRGWPNMGETAGQQV